MPNSAGENQAKRNRPAGGSDVGYILSAGAELRKVRLS